MWIGLAHGLEEGRQIPASINALNSALAAFNLSGLSRLGRSDTGVREYKYDEKPRNNRRI